MDGWMDLSCWWNFGGFDSGCFLLLLLLLCGEDDTTASLVQVQFAEGEVMAVM